MAVLGTTPRDQAVRAAAFAYLDRVARPAGGVIARTALEAGFLHDGARVPLVGPQGIFKPAAIDSGIPLTLTTAAPDLRRPRPYDDGMTEDGLRYRYRGSDPDHHENLGLRRALQAGVPLIYLEGLVPGRYLAHWPVYVVADDPADLSVFLRNDEAVAWEPDTAPLVDARRRYVTRLARQRLHQAVFREQVLLAYGRSCAMCRLRHEELLDAAHILPDTHPKGLPVVPNGLSLCRLHHAAFDADILGVRPDLVVEVRRDVLDEVDGPMLRHGLQELNGAGLIVPRNRASRPDPVLLEERYDTFRRAG
ncbi:MAG TPA: HNH endonuclease [Actinomycetota bacterium]|nr:HNH endonuclease [Actinomycetota bacterium]